MDTCVAMESIVSGASPKARVRSGAMPARYRMKPQIISRLETIVGAAPLMVPVS